MKANVYDLEGKKKKEIELPKVFDSVVREDIVRKCVEIFKDFQPHSLDPEAGRRHSASGQLSHKRHDWKGQYGKGISRVPRKIIWRRGVQFNWVGAEISGTRGGRRPHGHKVIMVVKKMNNKEVKIAFDSALASTAQQEYINKRYSLEGNKLHVPIVIESSKIESLKTKQFMKIVSEILGSFYERLVINRETRAGKGKARGRRYKSNAGMLMIKGNEENVKLSGIELRSVDDVEIRDLYPLGRIVIYTEKALEELK